MVVNQSLAHSLKILLLYDGSHPMFTVAEISNQLGYSQSKAYRLVRTFVKYGFLKENNGTGKYALGLNVLRLGLLAQREFNISAIARPFMKELSLLTKETVLLTAVNGTKGIVLERVESEEPIWYSLFQPGAHIPLHCGASSKVLMAYLTDGEWDRIIATEGLKCFTPNTITDGIQLKVHLMEIRKRGYAVSDQEVDRDVRAVAAPIFDGMENLVAGLSVTGPLYRITKKRLGMLAKLVSEYSQKISVQLMYDPKSGG